MNDKKVWSILLLASYFLLRYSVRGKDLPLNVTVKEIGTDFVVFEVAGQNSVNGLPVKSILVNYTEIAYNQSELVVLRSQQKSTKLIHLEFKRTVNVTNLNPGCNYDFKLYAVNTKNQLGPIKSHGVEVLLLPDTPDFSITHLDSDALRLFWGYSNEKYVDYFLLTVEKSSQIGCGFTLNFTRCYGNSYDLASIHWGETYILKFASHNPSGFSKTVVVQYPYE